MDTLKTIQKQRRLLSEKGARLLAERVRKEVPQSGRFRGLSVSFKIPGTGNEGRLIIEPSLTGSPEHRRLRIGVNRVGSDRLISNYLMNDTNENILKYLEKEGIAEELLSYYMSLSDRADEDD